MSGDNSKMVDGEGGPNPEEEALLATTGLV